VSKRKKTSASAPPSVDAAPASVEIEVEIDVPLNDSVTTQVVVPADLMKRASGEDEPALDARETSEDLDDEAIAAAEHVEAAAAAVAEAEAAEAAEEEHTPDSEGGHMPPPMDDDAEGFDAEMTVNLVGDLLVPARDDLDAPTVTASGEALAEIDRILLHRKHLRGLLEALVFASDSPIKPKDLGKLADAPVKQVLEVLAELKNDYATRGIHLDEVAGGWVFRTSPQYAPFVRDLTKQKPVRLTRSQVETLAIIAYRQPITRPEVDDVRGVDSGPVMKLLLERDLVRILGKRDEPGRPLIYGTTGNFLEFFGLKSLKDLPTLREFTELSDESRDTFEEELGEAPEDAARQAAAAERAAGHALEDGGTHVDRGGLGAEDDLGGEAAERDAGELERGDEIERELERLEGERELQDELDNEESGAPPPAPAGRSLRESMRVPVGEEPIDDLGEDDLEPMDSSVEGDVEPPESSEPHASDQDGPTLTSEAPGPLTEEDD